MKLLLDQNISFRLIGRISDIYPDSIHVKEAGLENASDKEIWEFGKQNGLTVVTFDSDFYDFALAWKSPPKIIWIKTFNQTTNNIELILRQKYESISAFLVDQNLDCLKILD